MSSTRTVHTRVVLRRRRADSRASTERDANRAATEPETTTPYRRDFEPRSEMENADLAAVPYQELVVATYSEVSATPATDTQDTTLEKPKVDVEDKTLEKPKHPVPTDDEETIDQPKADLDALLRELKPVVFANGSGKVAAIDTSAADASPPANERASSQGRTKAAHMTFLGVAVSQPQVGASLVIGEKKRADFCITSPVTHVFPREDGTLVRTASKSRYFVEPSGNAYLLRKKKTR